MSKDRDTETETGTDRDREIICVLNLSEGEVRKALELRGSADVVQHASEVGVQFFRNLTFIIHQTYIYANMYMKTSSLKVNVIKHTMVG